MEFMQWDSAQISQQAESSLYETYRPTDDDLSFEELRKLNPEVFGWLSVYGTHIDYPLVQGKDNIKYVNTDAKGNFALSGSIFLDARNNKSFQDINNILYGHHMEKKTMFGELSSFSNKDYFEKHQYGTIYYDDKWHGIEFFAFLHADAYDSILYNPKIDGEVGRKSYQNYVKSHAMNYREIQLENNDHYVILSTCTSDSTNGRHILVGRLTENIYKDSFDGKKETDK